MRHIFKNIIRNFISRPAINLINLTGLSLSLAVVIILAVYCYSEITTDRFHKNSDRVYLYVKSSGGIYTPGVLKETVDNKIPGIEKIVRMAGTWEPPVFEVEGNEPITSDLLFADDGFFNLFSYEAVDGDLKSALSEPMLIVITKALSEKLFGTGQSAGKIIKLNNDKLLTVSAVIEEPKANSCINFSALTSIATRKIVQGNGADGEFKEWGWNNFQTFFLLEKNEDPDKAIKSIAEFVPDNEKSNYKSNGANLTKLDKVYFSRFKLFGANYLAFGNKGKVEILLVVAILVLFVALVNYINISTSQWNAKIKQTGLMKVLGARRTELLKNMLVESFLFFLASLIIGIQVVGMVSPILGNFTGIRFNPGILYSYGFILLSLSSVLMLSIAFSIIPAIRLSASRAVDNLKKSVTVDKKNFSFSSFLVTVQFTIAVALIAFTFLVQKQVKYGSDNMGIKTDNIIGIKLSQQLGQKKKVLKNMLRDKPYVSNISFCQYFPGKVISQWGVDLQMKEGKKQVNFHTFNAEPEFFSMIDLQLVKGRFYIRDLATDKAKVIVNESFARENKIEDPLGCKFFGFDGNEYEITGIVKDFHFESFNTPIAPLAILNGSSFSYCLVNLNTRDFSTLKRSLGEIKSITSELSPSFPVEIGFFDQAVENIYRSELQFRRTFSLFSACAILISCLGILALSLFACQRRVKEIGIRKVNGARISEILYLLNRDFLRWVFIAFMISVPLSWYAMNRWLQGFAYKTEISWWIFVLAGMIVMIVAFITISFQTLRAATRNPVEALRYE
jgi:putative ABC transport system permease protein